MDIKNKLREALLKKQKRKYDYGCVMVGLDTDSKDWNKIQTQIDEDDIYFGDGTNGGFGRELDPHVTILFGLHADVSDKEIEERVTDIKKPEITLQKISAFENELFDVLKFDVESPDLHKLNKKFSELSHTTDYPNYHPHATICYLKKGESKKHIKELSTIEPILVSPNEILYSKPDGSKKSFQIKDVD